MKITSHSSKPQVSHSYIVCMWLYSNRSTGNQQSLMNSVVRTACSLYIVRVENVPWVCGTYQAVPTIAAWLPELISSEDVFFPSPSPASCPNPASISLHSNRNISDAAQSQTLSCKIQSCLEWSWTSICKATHAAPSAVAKNPTQPHARAKTFEVRSHAYRNERATWEGINFARVLIERPASWWSKQEKVIWDK